MSSFYWIKLYHEVLDDPKMGKLPDRAWRRCVELFLLAGDTESGGALPELADIAWRLRVPEDELLEDLQTLEAAGILGQNDGHWRVSNFTKRQKAVADNERQRQHRERKRTQERDESVTEDVPEGNTECHEPVTERNIDKSRVEESRKDSDSETEKIIMSASADYHAIRLRWIEFFPDKSKPRENNKTLSGKVHTRMKCPHFQEYWEAALQRASGSRFLHSGGWFDLGWFLKNDDNWEKCLNGNYDDKGNGGKSDRHARRPTERAVPSDPAADLEVARQVLAQRSVPQPAA